PAEWVEHDVALVARCVDDALEEGQGLLGCVSKPLCGARVEPEVGRCPHVLERRSLEILNVDFQTRHPGRCIDNPIGGLEVLHFIYGETPHSSWRRLAAFPVVLT